MRSFVVAIAGFGALALALALALGPGLAAAEPPRDEVAATGLPAPAAVAPSELTEAGRSARGVFVSPLSLRTRDVDRLAASLRGAQMTAVVTDLKDERGDIVYETTSPALAAQRQTPGPGNLRSLVGALRDRGLYVIGRIVCFRDPALARARPDLAVRDARNGRFWGSGVGPAWTSPYSVEVQDRLIAVARDAEALGFDEVQLDYIRFPMGEGADHAVFPQAQEEPRHAVIAQFLERLDASVGIPISVDLFGLTAFHLGGPTRLGQSVEDLAPHVEVLTPMLSARSFEGIALQPAHGQRTALLVSAAVTRLARRVGDAIVIRPILHTLPSREGSRSARRLHAQARAAQAAGADGILFWNRRSDYRNLYETLRAFGPLFERRP